MSQENKRQTEKVGLPKNENSKGLSGACQARAVIWKPHPMPERIRAVKRKTGNAKRAMAASLPDGQVANGKAPAIGPRA